MSLNLEHTWGICVKKATQKLGVLNRISSFLDLEKEKLVFDVH